MTNAAKLFASLVVKGTNKNGDPLVLLINDLSLPLMTVHQEFEMSLGTAVMETTLRMADSGIRCYLCRDYSERLQRAKNDFNQLESLAFKMSQLQAEDSEKVLVEVLGYLD
tara:strand:- start:447 stop:779 length:333 start_codon:yes stop_codon:yes gene_type:complete